MTIRTTEIAVQSLLSAGKDYDGKTDLLQFILAASTIVDRLVDYSFVVSINVTDSVAEVIETWLGAHAYQQSDKGRSERAIGISGKTSAKYQIDVGKGLDSTLYGQMAKLLDPTGYLISLDDGGPQTLQMIWLGKRPSQQIDYVDRD